MEVVALVREFLNSPAGSVWRARLTDKALSQAGRYQDRLTGFMDKPFYIPTESAFLTLRFGPGIKDPKHRNALQAKLGYRVSLEMLHDSLDATRPARAREWAESLEARLGKHRIEEGRWKARRLIFDIWHARETGKARKDGRNATGKVVGRRSKVRPSKEARAYIRDIRALAASADRQGF